MNLFQKFIPGVFIFLVAELMLVTCVAQAQELKTEPAAVVTMGLTREKPAEQPFVELPDGQFMIPYTTTIPGTKVEFTMTPIPGGKFTMGSPESEADRRDDEGPQFEVTVKPFWMGKYEVTWAEYFKFMAMDRLFLKLHGKGLRVMTPENEIDAITAPSELYEPPFTFEAGEDPAQPAATISQFAAKQYTKWLSLMSEHFYRLPTEAEWEYACRAGTKTAYYFGDDASKLAEHAWFSENADDLRHDVGQLKPNPWGLYDMYGNVAEWVLDQYTPDGYPHDAKASLTVAQAFVKPTELDPRVVRGGSFVLEAEDCRSAARVGSSESWRDTDPNYPKSPWWYTDYPATGVGFRLIRPFEEPATRSEKEVFWAADIEEIIDEARNRIEDNGRGHFGTVDKDLAKQIEEFGDEE